MEIGLGDVTNKVNNKVSNWWLINSWSPILDVYDEIYLLNKNTNE